jgi:hypothetical protein
VQGWVVYVALLVALACVPVLASCAANVTLPGPEPVGRYGRQACDTLGFRLDRNSAAGTPPRTWEAFVQGVEQWANRAAPEAAPRPLRDIRSLQDLVEVLQYFVERLRGRVMQQGLGLYAVGAAGGLLGLLFYSLVWHPLVAGPRAAQRRRQSVLEERFHEQQETT